MGDPRSPATTRAGRKRRDQILDHAVQLASVEGFDALAFGRLASDLSMSKSGLFAHFGSKEQLQAEAYQAAIEVFTRHVIRPTRAISDQQPAVTALVELWIDYLRAGVFAGGCILTQASSEFDGQPGPMRDAVAKSGHDWLVFIADLCRRDQRLGHLDVRLDPDDVAFGIRAAFLAMNWHHQLYRSDVAFDRGRRLVTQILAAERPQRSTSLTERESSPVR